MIKEGDVKAGRIAYDERSGSAEKILAIEFRTESCLQVYLPCSRYSLRLETMCCKVSDCRQKEHAEMDHYEKFFLVANVFVKYFREKLKIFLNSFC